MEKPIFFSDHLKKCLVVANKLWEDDKQKILTGLYEIGVNEALKKTKSETGLLYKHDLLFESDKINNMFNMFHTDKDLKGLFLPRLNWFKEAVRARLNELEKDN